MSVKMRFMKVYFCVVLLFLFFIKVFGVFGLFVVILTSLRSIVLKKSFNCVWLVIFVNVLIVCDSLLCCDVGDEMKRLKRMGKKFWVYLFIVVSCVLVILIVKVAGIWLSLGLFAAIVDVLLLVLLLLLILYILVLIFFWWIKCFKFL